MVVLRLFDPNQTFVYIDDCSVQHQGRWDLFIFSLLMPRKHIAKLFKVQHVARPNVNLSEILLLRYMNKIKKVINFIT